MLDIFKGPYEQLIKDLSKAKEDLDQGAGIKTLDLMHQLRIKEFETYLVLAKIKQREAELGQDLDTTEEV